MIGTSAGAQNLSAYICGQAGYARRVITRYTTNSAFLIPYALFEVAIWLI